MKIRFRKSNFMAGRGNACRPVLQRGESKGYGIRKAPLRNSQRRFKVAATYSPTTQCSTIGDAFSLPCALAPLRCLPPLLATQLSALSPARRRRAHRRPPRASDAFFSTQRPPLTHDYIKSMVSLFNTVFSLIRCSFYSRLFY